MSDPKPVLFIGNKNYSSWSLRPWLCLRWGGIKFEERLISLKQEGYGRAEIAEILTVSPAGKVPVLHVDGVAIWDSLAIAEWAAEHSPQLWPEDCLVRAQARSVTSEMHAGFADLRDQLPMNIRRRCKAHGLRAGTERDIARVLSMWSGLREQYAGGGPWLFGKRSIADAFFAPVITRFRTYGIALDGDAKAYSQTVLTDPDFLKWEASPITDRFEFVDSVYA